MHIASVGIDLGKTTWSHWENAAKFSSARSFHVRFLEVFAAWRTGTGDPLPDISEVLSWLNYLDSQCPECTQIEWPTDD